MTNILLTNSYQILGLDNTATQKEIIKRSKDILNLLAIDEKPEYDLDLGIFNKLRTESQVKEAAQNLAVPKKRIREYFFWFDIHDSTDGKAISLVQELDFSMARDVWKEALEKDNSRTDFYKKNLALVDLWILYEKDTQYALKESVSLWKELTESEEFWEDYSKIYKLNDDLSSDQEVINDFKKQLPAILSDIYTDFGRKHSTNTYLNEFVKAFGSKGEQLDKTVLTPLYQKINNALDRLDNIEIKSGETLAKTELTQIKESIQVVQDSFNEIIEVGLYDDSQTKVLRDKAATTIRRISLDFNNNIFEYKSAQGFIGIASSLAGTALLKDKIKVDVETIESNVADLELTDVTELIQKQKFKEAMELIDEKLSNDELPKITKNRLGQIKNAYSERLKTLGNPIKHAPPLFTIWGFGTNIYGDTLFLTALFFPVLPLARYTLEAQGDGRYIFYGRLPLTTKQRWWFWIGLIIGVVWLISVMGSSSNSPTTTSNSGSSNSSAVDCSNVSPGQYCCSSANSTEADGLKPDSYARSQLDSQSKKIDNDRLYLDNTDQASIDDFNAEVARYNQAQKDYNNKMDQYNNFLSQNCTLK